ncbi:hypothetical protein FRC17_002944 [Serendipita sp. 399]|nr:hypothetical protein FRC17_002944 [Serendipita sp. 399]
MLTVKAGRATRRETTSWVDPQPTKGLLGLALGDDGLLHLTWKNRETNTVEDDPSTSVLEQLETNVNGLLQDPEFQPTWSDPPTASTSNVTSSVPVREAVTSASDQQIDNNALTESIARQLQALIQQRTGRTGAVQAHQPSIALSDIISMSSLAPLFEPANSATLQPLEEFLPPDLPKDETSTQEETLRRVIQSGPFRSTVRQLDRALATGLLGRLMPGFGLPEEAGLSVESFLRAIHEKARKEHEGQGPE